MADQNGTEARNAKRQGMTPAEVAEHMAKLARDPQFKIVPGTSREEYMAQIAANPRFKIRTGTGEAFIIGTQPSIASLSRIAVMLD
jgi:hypothetical protein